MGKLWTVAHDADRIAPTESHVVLLCAYSLQKDLDLDNRLEGMVSALLDLHLQRLNLRQVMRRPSKVHKSDSRIIDNSKQLCISQAGRR